MDLQIGSLLLRPTQAEKALAGAGAAAVVVGWCAGSRAISALGALALAGVALACWEEAQTFTAPELMNGYFQTGGRLSATHGAGEAATMAGVR